MSGSPVLRVPSLYATKLGRVTGDQKSPWLRSSPVGLKLGMNRGGFNSSVLIEGNDLELLQDGVYDNSPASGNESRDALYVVDDGFVSSRVNRVTPGAHRFRTDHLRIK